MGHITKDKLDKHFKKVYKKAFKKMIQERVKEIAKGEVGDNGKDHVVIDDISLEITCGVPDGIIVSEKSKNKACKNKKSRNKKSRNKASKTNAVRPCVYYCYVIGGARICRRLWC